MAELHRGLSMEAAADPVWAAAEDAEEALQVQALLAGSSLYGDGAYAHAGNLTQCTGALNQALAIAGFPQPLVLEGASAAEAAQTCNAIFALLTARQRDSEARSAATDAQRRLASDCARAEAAAQRARAAAEKERDDAAAAARREQAAAVVHAAALQRAAAARDAAEKERASLAFKLVQAATDARRREKERDALAEKLRSLLADGGSARSAAARSRAAPVGIYLSGPPRASADAAEVSPAAAVVSRAVVDGLRSECVRAEEESAELREALSALRDELRAVRAAVRAPPPEGDDDAEADAPASDDEAAAAAEAAAGTAAPRDASVLPFRVGGGAAVARVRRDCRALRSWALRVAALQRAAEEAAAREAAREAERAAAAAAVAQTRGDALVELGGGVSRPGSRNSSADSRTSRDSQRRAA